ncbi:hypothetical protein NDU88_001569 [Pleurodeles waltl]|uniref:Uncharacterized protein n=1 Tax=Pleurodeles waltl TaxID=8319 RepID=A0AAV7Q7G8_PLEWA|nr:hypothetical protein NDU88_001569 [Pleurodeles waltl]
MTAVKCAGIPNWIHASHMKKVACPLDHEKALLRAPTTVKQVSATEPENKPREPEIEQELVEDGSITPTTTLTALEKFKLDEKYLHDYTNAQGELSSNVFYRLLRTRTMETLTREENATFFIPDEPDDEYNLKLVHMFSAVLGPLTKPSINLQTAFLSKAPSHYVTAVYVTVALIAIDLSVLRRRRLLSDYKAVSGAFIHFVVNRSPEMQRPNSR